MIIIILITNFICFEFLINYKRQIRTLQYDLFELFKNAIISLNIGIIIYDSKFIELKILIIGY
jgi:hypothetical protein